MKGLGSGIQLIHRRMNNDIQEGISSKEANYLTLNNDRDERKLHARGKPQTKEQRRKDNARAQKKRAATMLLLHD